MDDGDDDNNDGIVEDVLPPPNMYVAPFSAYAFSLNVYLPIICK